LLLEEHQMLAPHGRVGPDVSVKPPALAAVAVDDISQRPAYFVAYRSTQAASGYDR